MGRRTTRLIVTVVVAHAPALTGSVAGSTEAANWSGGAVLVSRAVDAGNQRSEIAAPSASWANARSI
jgi:glycine cleavage system regulatory protein